MFWRIFLVYFIWIIRVISTFLTRIKEYYYRKTWYNHTWILTVNDPVFSVKTSTWLIVEQQDTLFWNSNFLEITRVAFTWNIYILFGTKLKCALVKHKNGYLFRIYFLFFLFFCKQVVVFCEQSQSRFSVGTRKRHFNFIGRFSSCKIIGHQKMPAGSFLCDVAKRI